MSIFWCGGSRFGIMGVYLVDPALPALKLQRSQEDRPPISTKNPVRLMIGERDFFNAYLKV